MEQRNHFREQQTNGQACFFLLKGVNVRMNGNLSEK